MTRAVPSSEHADRLARRILHSVRHDDPPQSEWEALQLAVERVARRLARRFPWAFADGRSAKNEVIRWIRAALPPHPGRPRKPSVTRACQLKRQGTAWRDIYRECIPHYAALNWRDRRLEIRRLRNACRGRRRLARSQQSKNRSPISHEEKN